MGQVNKFHRWLSLTSRDIRITWRFEVKIPHKTKRASFIGLRVQLWQTILPEVSALNWSCSKQWIRVQCRTGRHIVVFRDLNMKNFSGARLDVSIHKNRLQGTVTPAGMSVNAVIFCLSAFPFPFWVSKC